MVGTDSVIYGGVTTTSPADDHRPRHEDMLLAKLALLTRREVIARRLHRVKQLARCYRGHYWSLMEDLKSKYKDYYWTYGKSPFKDDTHNPDSVVLGNTVNDTDNVVFGDDAVQCAYGGCKSKAMALTSP